MADDAPVPRLVNAILLSAIKRGAGGIRITHREGTSVVDFRVDGAIAEEMRPPPLLHGPLIRRLGVMASLPVHRPGEEAHGTFELALPDRRVRFALRVRGHGPALEAVLDVLPA